MLPKLRLRGKFNVLKWSCLFHLKTVTGPEHQQFKEERSRSASRSLISNQQRQQTKRMDPHLMSELVKAENFLSFLIRILWC